MAAPAPMTRVSELTRRFTKLDSCAHLRQVQWLDSRIACLNLTLSVSSTVVLCILIITK